MSNQKEEESNFVLIVENQFENNKMLKDKIKNELIKQKDTDNQEQIEQQSVFSEQVLKEYQSQSKSQNSNQSKSRRTDQQPGSSSDQSNLKNQIISPASTQQSNDNLEIDNEQNQLDRQFQKRTSIQKQKSNQSQVKVHGKYDTFPENKTEEISINYFQEKTKISTIYEENSRLENNSSSMYLCSANDHNIDFKKDTSPDQQYSIIQKKIVSQVQDFDIDSQKNQNFTNIIQQEQLTQKDNLNEFQLKKEFDGNHIFESPRSQTKNFKSNVLDNSNIQLRKKQDDQQKHQDNLISFQNQDKLFHQQEDLNSNNFNMSKLSQSQNFDQFKFKELLVNRKDEFQSNHKNQSFQNTDQTNQKLLNKNQDFEFKDQKQHDFIKREDYCNLETPQRINYHEVKQQSQQNHNQSSSSINNFIENLSHREYKMFMKKDTNAVEVNESQRSIEMQNCTEQSYGIKNRLKLNLQNNYQNQQQIMRQNMQSIQKMNLRSPSQVSIASFENYQHCLSISVTQQDKKFRAEKAKFDLERELYNQKKDQLMEELQDAERREKMSKEIHRKTIEALEKNMERTKEQNEYLQQENVQLEHSNREKDLIIREKDYEIMQLKHQIEMLNAQNANKIQNINYIEEQDKQMNEQIEKLKSDMKTEFKYDLEKQNQKFSKKEFQLNNEIISLQKELRQKGKQLEIESQEKLDKIQQLSDEQKQVAKLKKEKEDLFKKVGEMRLKLEKTKQTSKKYEEIKNESCLNNQNSVKKQKIFGRQNSPLYTSQDITSKNGKSLLKTMRSEIKLQINDNSITEDFYKYQTERLNMEVTSPTSYQQDVDQQQNFNQNYQKISTKRHSNSIVQMRASINGSIESSEQKSLREENRFHQIKDLNNESANLFKQSSNHVSLPPLSQRSKSNVKSTHNQFLRKSADVNRMKGLNKKINIKLNITSPNKNLACLLKNLEDHKEQKNYMNEDGHDISMILDNKNIYGIQNLYQDKQKLNIMTQLCAQLRNQLGKTRIQLQDNKKEFQQQIDKLQKELLKERQIRQQLQEEKYQIRQQMMDKIENKDCEIQKLRINILNSQSQLKMNNYLLSNEPSPKQYDIEYYSQHAENQVIRSPTTQKYYQSIQQEFKTNFNSNFSLKKIKVQHNSKNTQRSASLQQNNFRQQLITLSKSQQKMYKKSFISKRNSDTNMNEIKKLVGSLKNNNQQNLIEDTPLNFDFKIDQQTKQISIFNQRNTSKQISPLKIKDMLKNNKDSIDDDQICNTLREEFSKQEFQEEIMDRNQIKNMGNTLNKYVSNKKKFPLVTDSNNNTFLQQQIVNTKISYDPMKSYKVTRNGKAEVLFSEKKNHTLLKSYNPNTMQNLCQTETQNVHQSLDFEKMKQKQINQNDFNLMINPLSSMTSSQNNKESKIVIDHQKDIKILQQQKPGIQEDDSPDEEWAEQFNKTYDGLNHFALSQQEQDWRKLQLQQYYKSPKTNQKQELQMQNLQDENKIQLFEQFNQNMHENINSSSSSQHFSESNNQLNIQDLTNINQIQYKKAKNLQTCRNIDQYSTFSNNNGLQNKIFGKRSLQKKQKSKDVKQQKTSLSSCSSSGVYSLTKNDQASQNMIQNFNKNSYNQRSQPIGELQDVNNLKSKQKYGNQKHIVVLQQEISNTQNPFRNQKVPKVNVQLVESKIYGGGGSIEDNHEYNNEETQESYLQLNKKNSLTKGQYQSQKMLNDLQSLSKIQFPKSKIINVHNDDNKMNKAQGMIQQSAPQKKQIEMERNKDSLQSKAFKNNKLYQTQSNQSTKPQKVFLKNDPSQYNTSDSIENEKKKDNNNELKKQVINLQSEETTTKAKIPLIQIQNSNIGKRNSALKKVQIGESGGGNVLNKNSSNNKLVNMKSSKYIETLKTARLFYM